MGLLALERLVRGHLRQYPELEAADLVKLIWQGALGMDHLLGDEAAFVAELAREWEALDPSLLPGEPLAVRVHPTDPVVRLHLRPLKAAGLDPRAVGRALARQPRRGGSVGEFRSLWEGVLALAADGRIPFSLGELADVGRRALRGGPPAHSPRYRERYRPAYRLVHDATSPAWGWLWGAAGAGAGQGLLAAPALELKGGVGDPELPGEEPPELLPHRVGGAQGLVGDHDVGG